MSPPLTDLIDDGARRVETARTVLPRGFGFSLWPRPRRVRTVHRRHSDPAQDDRAPRCARVMAAFADTRGAPLAGLELTISRSLCRPNRARRICRPEADSPPED